MLQMPPHNHRLPSLAATQEEKPHQNHHHTQFKRQIQQQQPAETIYQNYFNCNNSTFETLSNFNSDSNLSSPNMDMTEIENFMKGFDENDFTSNSNNNVNEPDLNNNNNNKGLPLQNNLNLNSSTYSSSMISHHHMPITSNNAAYLPATLYNTNYMNSNNISSFACSFEQHDDSTLSSNAFSCKSEPLQPQLPTSSSSSSMSKRNSAPESIKIKNKNGKCVVEKHYGPIVVRPRRYPAPTLNTGRQSKYTVLTAEEERKRQIRRERNRQAAEKCKHKRSEIETELNAKYALLMDEKKHLDDQQRILQREIARLEQIFTNHKENSRNSTSNSGVKMSNYASQNFTQNPLEYSSQNANTNFNPSSSNSNSVYNLYNSTQTANSMTIASTSGIVSGGVEVGGTLASRTLTTNSNLPVQVNQSTYRSISSHSNVQPQHQMYQTTYNTSNNNNTNNLNVINNNNTSSSYHFNFNYNQANPHQNNHQYASRW
jgi:hypothetical protein